MTSTIPPEPVRVEAVTPAAYEGRLGAATVPGWRLALATFAENRPAVVSTISLVLIILFSYVGPLIYRTNQVAANLALQSRPPSAAFPLGTTQAGQDELGRLMLAGQSTLEVGLAVAIFSTGFGLVWGLVAGYFGGLVDAVLMRIVDALLSIPFFFFVVLLASIVMPTLWLLILVITAASWQATARLVRGEALSLRARDFVRAAHGFGSSRSRILFRHLTPNLFGVLSVNATLKVADSILAYATISYLGLGLPPPATDWGTLLTEGINNLFDSYWWQLWPAAFLIVVTVVVINLIGDGLRDVTEGRLQRR